MTSCEETFYNTKEKHCKTVMHGSGLQSVNCAIHCVVSVQITSMQSC